MPLYWYSSMKKKIERFRWFLKLKIDFENQILAHFDGYFWPFNNSHEKIKSTFVISTFIPSIWNVFIKFRWHDEKLIQGRHGWQGWQGPQGLVPRFCVSIRSYKNRPAQIRRGIPVIGKSLKYILKCVTLILSTAQRLSL